MLTDSAAQIAFTETLLYLDDRLTAAALLAEHEWKGSAGWSWRTRWGINHGSGSQL
jgi:hypothetical protein